MRRVLPFLVVAIPFVSAWVGGPSGRVRGRDALLVAESAAQGPAGPVHKFQRIADGVYSALATGAMNVGSNSAVIINERDVLIVDSHITPASARALLKEIETLTDKPVRYVVNTHYHFDHAHGNQVFPPEVEIIGHEFTRAMLLTDVLQQRTYVSFTAGLPKQIEELKAQAAREADPTKREDLLRRLAVQQDYLEALKEVEPTPPNLTFRTTMTLYRGGREIQLHFFGRGHTGGDVVVLLPKERVLCTGDLLTAGLSYAGDAFVNEWIATLEAVKALDFETVIPGHGEPFTGKERIEHFQRYLKDLWTQAVRLRAAGVPAEEAAQRIDLSAHRAVYPQIQGPGVDPRAVVRIYELLAQR